ncbi:MAG TPA: lipid-binding SYLF domain-containing protein, partial [Nitrospirota bacterium]|nr:lipid-binding SYLF domain-containing protein [Nitrospirota bacterium]
AVLIVLAQIFIRTVPASASDVADARITMEQAKITLDTFLNDGNNTFLQDSIKNAKGILIFPQVLKGGFFWGAGGGTGVLSVRDERTGEWSQPAFYTIGSVSFGFQIGAQAAEVVVLAMSQKAIDTLFSSSVKLGGSVSVAVGPYGSGINKDVVADFISFSRSKGLYAGLDIVGSVLAVRDDLNKAYYGREVRPVEIIIKKEVSSTDSAPLLESLKRRNG